MTTFETLLKLAWKDGYIAALIHANNSIAHEKTYEPTFEDHLKTFYNGKPGFTDIEAEFTKLYTKVKQETEGNRDQGK